ncbi:RNA-directed DNA polymerase, eukaryota, Reverse transcriptase zinc-binding domain protein [Artemisia annua]|uniref:RNA-directed DNA polymerase, eukaryota, Reverse transcriptase zinc-binding domain protein n=1 Tax=Artemisia annua TaxID=35608 RepID=A0A2U1KUC2_ARTAN|nr:RNA-directed DNA polymerase, eukaryota, Reverse transcriptase zinc-binding domain protein [Artemisia annua]
MVRLDHAPSKWSDIQAYILSRPINKSIWSILQRLVIGACIYFVWIERNLRIFQGRARKIDDICTLIKDTVRLRVLGLNLNDSDQVFEAADMWEFHVNRVVGKKKIMFSDGRRK